MKQQTINVLHVFPELNAGLIKLLNEIAPEDWENETCLKGRSVKDLVSHLVDTSLRRLAIDRDGYFSTVPEINSHQDLVSFIQTQNNDWFVATKRLSPKILISLLQSSGEELTNFLMTLDPHGKALFPVDWAGESESENWFDIAREYTEKWHHQMQIRDAIGIEGELYEKKYFKPIIESFLKAIPNAYSKLNKSDFTLTIEITGDCGGIYTLYKDLHSVSFISPIQSENQVSIKQAEFCKLVTNSKLKDEVKIIARGDETITSHFKTVVAVMS